MAFRFIVNINLCQSVKNRFDQAERQGTDRQGTKTEEDVGRARVGLFSGPLS